MTTENTYTVPSVELLDEHFERWGFVNLTTAITSGLSFAAGMAVWPSYHLVGTLLLVLAAVSGGVAATLRVVMWTLSGRVVRENVEPDEDASA